MRYAFIRKKHQIKGSRKKALLFRRWLTQLYIAFLLFIQKALYIHEYIRMWHTTTVTERGQNKWSILLNDRAGLRYPQNILDILHIKLKNKLGTEEFLKAN